MRQRNEQFGAKARSGKNPVNASRKEKLAKQSPIGLWALGIVLFVVVGGGTYDVLFRPSQLTLLAVIHSFLRGH